jgi:3-methyl-2-oxobutanoate hydroxymethyltransferase
MSDPTSPEPGIRRAGIALGSNAGTRRWFLRSARESLAALPGVAGPVLSSRVYETAPVDCPPGAGDFLNAVVEIGWAGGDARALLEDLQALERAFGRAPAGERGRNEPRTLDLDLLYIEGVELGDAELALPHPRLAEREFVLRPLADIRPEVVLPGQSATVAELFEKVRGTQGVAERGQGWYLAEPRILPGPEELEGAPLAPALGNLAAAKREGRRLATLTATDFATGRLVDEGGVDLILVGDSLGMVALGFADTVSVTLEDMVRHTAAVRRGAANTLVVADLPYNTYETAEQAVESAARLIEEGGADAVKLEGGRARAEAVREITRRGYPLLAHLGMLPQRVRLEGGYRVKGRTPEEAAALLEDALAVQEAGAFGIVLELVLPAVAEEITHKLRIPTIGIGSGTVCDGEILVTADLVGGFPWFVPRFAKQFGDVAGQIRQAVRAWKTHVGGQP